MPTIPTEIAPETPTPIAPTSDAAPTIVAPVTPTIMAPTPAAAPKPIIEEEIDEVIPLEKKNRQLYKIGIGLFIGTLIITGLIFYLRTQTISTVSEVEITPTQQPVVETTLPTLEIKILKRDEITLEILNGTSTSGLAGKTADEFKELGYKIGDVGNNDNIKSNQLFVKTEYADQLDNLLEDVKTILNITEISGEIDDLDSTARLILGGK